MADIFLSYSREDRAAVEPLAEQIAAAGYSVWWDRQLTGGKRYLEETEAELNAAMVVLVAWSKTSIASHWVADEAGAGRDTGRLLPITLDGSMPPLGFRQFQVIDCSKWTRDDGAALEQLIDALGKLTAPSSAPTAAPKARAATKPLFQQPLMLGGIAAAAVALVAVVATNLIAPSQSATDNRLTAFFGFTPAGLDPAVATMAGDANAETYKTFAALGLETVSEASTTNVPLAQQLDTATKLNARYAVGGEVRKSASGFDIALRIDDIRHRKTLWRETISGSQKDTIILPVAAAEQAGGTIRCLNRMFKDIPSPGDELIAALARACASRRLTSEERVSAWRAAAKLAPDSPVILAMVGSSLAATNTQASPATREQLRREVVDVLTRALKLEPGLRDAQTNLAMNQTDNAADLNRSVTKVAGVSPGDAEPMEPAVPDMIKGLSLISVGQFADATTLLRQAVQADSLFYPSRLWLGMSLMQNGQMREGRAIYEQAITRAGSPSYWNFWAMQELSDPAALAHALELAPPSIAADTTDCVRSLATAVAEKRLGSRAPGAEPVLACLRRTGPSFVLPAASTLGDLDQAFAEADQLPLAQSVVLQLTVTRPMRADSRFLPLMKKRGAWQHWVETKTLPDWCKLPEEQGFETCVALRKVQGK
jgi:hypothetical protein